MLISQETAHRWYRRDSWVYKNFSYLFNNPLWKKRVPYGFSLCPYFWLSLFALFVVRPFVFVVQYGIQPPLRKCGKPAAKVDEWLYRVIPMKITGDYHFGAGFMSLITGFLLAAVALIALTIYGAKSLEYYRYVAAEPTGTRLGQFAYWGIQSFIWLFSIICLHKTFSRSECKTWTYLLVWAVLFFGLAFVFIPSELWAGTSHVLSVVGLFLKQVFVGAWNGVVVVAKFIGKWAWVIFNFIWIWVLCAVGLGVLGWLASKIHFNHTITSIESRAKTMTPEEIEAQNRRAWIHFFVRLFGKNYWDSSRFIADNIHLYTEAQFKAAQAIHKDLFYTVVEKYFRKQLDKLQKVYPFPNMTKWEDFREYSLNSRFTYLQEVFDEPLPTEVEWDESNFRKVIRNLLTEGEWADEMKRLTKMYTEMEMRKLELEKKRKASKAHVLCLRVTNGLADIFSNIGEVISDLCKETGTFVKYLWAMCKAKKQGACPFMTFVDPPKPGSVASAQAGTHTVKSN